MTGGSESGRVDRVPVELEAGKSDDAVAQARRWLAERGLSVPDAVADPLMVPSRPPERHLPRTAARSAPRSPSSSDGPDLATTPLSAADPVGASDPGHPTDPDADPETVARTIVLRKLAAQARTRVELSRALEAKQVPVEAAEAVLDRMEAVGLIDDQGFARDWVESRQQRRHLSKTALRRELTAKGVDREQIDSALEEVDTDDELQAARSLAAKKATVMSGLDAQVRYRRLAGMLGRRGFNPGVINQVVNETFRSGDH